MLEIKRFIFGPFGTNTYVVSGIGCVLIIDPACYDETEKRELEQYVESVRGEEEVKIIATHGHLDHLWGAGWATKRWQTAVMIDEADRVLVEHMQLQYDLFGIRDRVADRIQTASLTDRLRLTEHRPPSADRIQTELQVIKTPGHTEGSVSLYFEKEGVLFSGDTLFQMGYGRTDLPGGDYGKLMNSLETLFALPASTRVYPGHGGMTTIGAERR